MKRLFFILALFLIPIILVESADAHCPLCTVGAGAAAAGAAWLGVSKVVIGLLIGAFAMSMGMWFARIPKRQFVPFQRTLIIGIIFFTTILQLLPIFTAIGPLYLPFIGEYGKTFAVNYSLASSFLGGTITFVSPSLNKKIKEKRNSEGIIFQGILLTFSLLAIAALIIQSAI